MDEEEKLKRITKLLEQGCTMLASHHSCGAPLFRCKGEIVCPVCSYAGVDECSVASGRTPSDEVSRPAEEKGSPEGVAGTNKEFPDLTTQKDLGFSEDELKRSVWRKLKELTEGLEGEQDLDKIRKQLDCIEGALKVLKSLAR